MKILIIEDELPAARQLAKLIAQHRPHWHVGEPLDSISEAVRRLAQPPAPDLIFMDIQIADGLSFDIFRQVEVGVPVIFTTAFDQYAVQAFRVAAVDYLLKPVEPDDLAQAIARVEARFADKNQLPDLAAFTHFFQKNFEKQQWKERFLIKSGQHFVFLQTSEIAFFASADGLTQAATFAGKRHFVDSTLDELERLVDPARFFRVSRNLMLSPDSIRRISTHFNGRLKLELTPDPDAEVFVSRERVSDFKAWLGG